MRFLRLLSVFFVLMSAVAFAQETDAFRTFQKVEMPPARIYTVSPAQVRAGIVTQVVVQGENFRPRNDWTFPGIRVLKEQFVNRSTVVLTVLATGNAGLREVAVGQKYPVTLEVLAPTVLLSDDFDDGDISDWTPGKGTWTPTSGCVEVTSTKVGELFPTLDNTDNITVDWDMTLLSGKFAGIQFHYRDSKNYRLLVLDGNRGVLRLKDYFGKSVETKLKTLFPGNINDTHHYTLVVSNNAVTVSVDGNQVLNSDLGYVYTGQVVLYSKAATARFDNVVITRDTSANVVPVADFTASASGASGLFNAASSYDPDGTISSYSWNFGDSTTGSGISTTHDYTASGTYTVILSVTDNAGARTKTTRTITINTIPNDAQAITDVVTRFFVLLADLEWRSPQQICSDFSRDPACPAYDKQVTDLEEMQPTVQWFDVQFLSPVDITFQTPTQAYPVKIRNKLEAIYYGDPNYYYTDGWHIYWVQKEADGKWHQCKYTFQLVSTNEN